MLDKYRFQPRLGGTLVALLGTAVFVALMVWQLGRADEKRALQELIETRMALPPLAYQGGELDLDTLQYRQLQMQGHFENAGQVLLDNVVLEGRPGYRVITPFRLADGGHVLVDRGWVAQGARRDQLPDITVDSGPVAISGRADRHRSRPVVGAAQPSPDGSLRWLYIDTDFYVRQYGIAVPDFVVRLAPDSPQGFRVDDTAYDAKVGMHIGYAIQWGAFALIAAATWFGLSWKRRQGEKL